MLTVIALGNNDIALADIDQAINLNPENAIAYNNRAFTYLNKGENDLAIDAANQSLSLEIGESGE